MATVVQKGIFLHTKSGTFCQKDPPSVDPGVGLNDPLGSLPAQDIL